MPTSNKRIVVYIVIAIIVILGIAVIIWYANNRNFSNRPNTNNASNPRANPYPTRVEAPKNITVPEPGSATGTKNIAVPSASVPAAPGATSNLRVFNIEANAGQYTPSTIIVNIGDNVAVNLKAIDAAYDIVFPDYNLSQTVKKGETKVIAFQAVINGQFSFYCQSLCPNGKMTGTLIVKSK